MQTIKLSYTMLNAWSQGRQEDAIGMYLGKDLPATPAMELGKLMHKQWENHVNETGQLPDEFGGGALVRPVSEQKYRKLFPFGDDYQILLSGIIDLEERDSYRITDYKCGRGEAGSYVDSFQLPYYKLLVPEAREGVYRAWNPYLHKATFAIRFLGDADAEAALNHLFTYGGELIDYLAANKLIIDYKGVGV